MFLKYPNNRPIGYLYKAHPTSKKVNHECWKKIGGLEKWPVTLGFASCLLISDGYFY